jgi:hypothetical protein
MFNYHLRKHDKEIALAASIGYETQHKVFRAVLNFYKYEALIEIWSEDV